MAGGGELEEGGEKDYDICDCVIQNLSNLVDVTDNRNLFRFAHSCCYQLQSTRLDKFLYHTFTYAISLHYVLGMNDSTPNRKNTIICICKDMGTAEKN